MRRLIIIVVILFHPFAIDQLRRSWHIQYDHLDAKLPCLLWIVGGVSVPRGVPFSAPVIRFAVRWLEGEVSGRGWFRSRVRPAQAAPL